jgi:malonyl-CoA/methylmalonyl-CoA synthetase
MSLLSLYASSLIDRRTHAALEVESADGAVQSFTFGELDARSDAMAIVLRARGVQPGDRLGVCLANDVCFIDLWLAAVKLGVMLVPMNVLYRGHELGHIVSDARPEAVVTTASLAEHFPEGTRLWDRDMLDAARTHAQSGIRVTITPFSATDDTPIALIYTSGTTGAAKGAVLTHGNFAANARALLRAWHITSADRYLATLPLFHVHGLGNGVQCWLASGCHMRLTERFDHARAPTWFTSYRPTVFFGVPTMYVRLLDLPRDAAQTIGASVRLFVSGSAPLPATVLTQFAERFGHVILERYGMTETLMNVSNPYDGERRAGTVGVPLPGVQVVIRDELGAAVADGVSGELWVRGANVCAGYWERPEATADAFVDGWFRTGDLGVRAPDGYITLQGRRSDLIISGGFNIYPRELEELLLTLAGVREVAVVGVADARRGEVPVAYYVGETVDPDALDAALRARVASFKVPRAFVRVDALPRTALGKVQKHRLPAP